MMPRPKEQTILLVSDDAAFCAAARRELEAKEEGLRVAAVSTVDAARRIVVDAAPAVILLEETSVVPESQEHPGRSRRAWNRPSPLWPRLLRSSSSEASRPRGGTDALVAAGLADFVARSGGCLPVALDLVEQRLRQAPNPASAALPAVLEKTRRAEAFGEVLRHELNNPLTGILGNAELLLAEVRRKNDGQLPNGGQQRLETIAALAVRLRETVRRLSEDWESRTSIAADAGAHSSRTKQRSSFPRVTYPSPATADHRTSPPFQPAGLLLGLPTSAATPASALSPHERYFCSPRDTRPLSGAAPGASRTGRPLSHERSCRARGARCHGAARRLRRTSCGASTADVARSLGAGRDVAARRRSRRLGGIGTDGCQHRCRPLWTGALGSDDFRVRMLEVRGSAPLSDSVRAQLDVLARFAAVVLALAERRGAMEELSSIIEATKRLNSTLDLGELIHIILQIATRQTGAERGTVFLMDRERKEMWSLVGLGLDAAGNSLSRRSRHRRMGGARRNCGAPGKCVRRFALRARHRPAAGFYHAGACCASRSATIPARSSACSNC